MTLKRPFAPMEALSVENIPIGDDWYYEPKWDGFRCLVFKDGRSIELQSKSGQSLTRYFPELVSAVAEVAAPRFVLDGEIVVPDGRSFSFDKLLQRIHPAASRVNKLAADTPGFLIAFDLLLSSDGNELIAQPFAERRKALESFAKRYLRAAKSFRLSPVTPKVSDAMKWLKQVGAALDGIIAKRRDLAYQSGNRLGMQKIKNHRSADCVVGGFRYNEGKPIVGSLLLGLYNEQGLLDHVGFTSSFKADEKKPLTTKLERWVGGPGFTGSAPGGPSRWSSKRSAEWQPLKPKFVVEVSYDHFNCEFLKALLLRRFTHTEQNMSIKSLTFAALPKGGAADPASHRRNKLIERLRQQIELAEDPAFKLTRQKWVVDSAGVKRLVEQHKKVRPWWRQDAAGNVILAVHYGAQKVEMERGKAGIVVGKKDKLIPTIETVIEAVSSGELDTILLAMSKTAVQAKGSKRAA